MTINIGILTATDRLGSGNYEEDISGKAVIELLGMLIRSEWTSLHVVVPDDRRVIERELRRLVDREACCLLLTIGGTGPAPRDVTPEATEAVCDKLLPGFGEAMRAAALRNVPTAILSRQQAGIRGKSLIINLPSRPQAIKNSLEAVFPAVPNCIELIGGPKVEGNADYFPAAAQV